MTRARSTTQAAPSSPPPPEIEEPKQAKGGDLGPAVTPEFENVLGLQELESVGGSAGTKRSAGRTDGADSAATDSPAATSPAAPPVPPQVYAQLIKLIDATTSSILAIEKEDDATLESIARMIQPLGDFYSAGPVSLTAIWGYAITGVLSLTMMKYAKYRKAHPPKSDEPSPSPDGSPPDGSAAQ